ncbi:MAG TPA: DUF3488 and transglutaminase-like domain-containing protein [Cellulomonadaceae bacterium]|nr:DUF3488 and transglutaminase-like domain-containing protein [Cellulomonadaceae bacterium]
MIVPSSLTRAVTVRIACAAMVAGGLGALTAAVAPGRWIVVSFLAVAALAAVVGLLRRGSRNAVTPTVAGLAVSALALTLGYGGPGGTPSLVFDGGTFGRLVQTAHEAVSQANGSFPPMASSTPIEMLLVAGAMVVYLLLDAVAVGLRAPAWSGLVAIALWVPTTVLGLPAPWWGFAISAIGYLMLLAASTTTATSGSNTLAERARVTSLTARYIAAVAVAALLVAPALAYLPAWASVTLPTLGNDVGGPVHISSDLDLRSDLGSRSGQVILTYTTTSPDIGPLRVFTMTTFNGRSWSDPEAPATDLVPVVSGGPLVPVGADPPAAAGVGVQVTIGRLQDVHLPITIAPREVTIAGSWSYDAARDEVLGRQPTTAGMSYSMSASIPTWTAAQLAAAGRIADVPVESLTVPQTSKTSAVRLIAQKVTAGATTPYEQAVALQNYFRDSRNFTYDTTVAPVVSDDAVWDFLQGKRGYCVHFATAMTVMARMLGIPARIAVGFLPGQANGTTYTVTGKQTHAWPELYFAGAGWVRFEPTPAVQTGLAPAWTSPATAPGSTPSPSATSESSHPQSSSIPTVAPTAGSAGTAGSTTSWPLGWPWSGGAVAIAVLGTALGLLGLRRRRRAANLDPEAAWATLRKQITTWGVEWSDASTPRAVVAAVTRRVRDAGAELTQAEHAALHTLATAVEDRRYAPEPSEPTSSDLRRQVTVVSSAVARAVSDRPARDGGPNALPAAP